MKGVKLLITIFTNCGNMKLVKRNVLRSHRLFKVYTNLVNRKVGDFI